MSIPAVRFRVDFRRDAAVGPGKISLLEHIGACGSLSQAARELHMSYRRAWQLLESLNRGFREPVATTSRGGRGGGGAILTGLGRQLISLYRTFDRQTQARAARCFRPIAAKVRNMGPPGAAARRASQRGAAAPIRLLQRR
jgi:molybdate transport system regulatory protein